MKLLGFTGAGGTGKSTVASRFSVSVPSNVDAIRKIIYGADARYGDLSGIEFFSFQNVILMAQYHTELKHLRKYKDSDDIIIPVERSSIDYAAYTLQLKNKDYDTYLLLKPQIDKYIENCIEHANKSYDCLVYFPANKFLANEDPNSSKERNIISAMNTDNYIQNLISKLRIPVLTLNKTEIVARYDEILNYVNEI